jgi:hypothetical protein
MVKKEYELLKKNLAEFLRHNKDVSGSVDERDEMIKLAIESRLSFNQIQQILILSGKGKLYPRYKRDAAIIHALSNRKTVEEVNAELEQLGESKL